jgi:hypothetical protein
MEDFNIVLVAAVVSFMVLLIAFNSNFTFSGFDWSDGFGDNGGSHFVPDRTVEFNNFVVYYTASEEKVGYAIGQVTNGAFGGQSQKAGFQVSRPTDVSEAIIDINVSDTNYYGRLIASINGKEVYADYPVLGEELISFDKSLLRSDNLVEFAAESSGWRIWAPTVYDINSSVTVNYFGKKTMSFTFDVNDKEIDRMDRARVSVFGDRQGNGNLGITINGVKIYSGVTTAYRDFATTILKSGNNTIDFYTEPNTRYNITSAQVILFFQ